MLNTCLNVIRFSVQFISGLLISWLWQINESTVVSDLILSSISSEHWQVSRTRFRQVINHFFLFVFRLSWLVIYHRIFSSWKASSVCYLGQTHSLFICCLTFPVRHKPCVLCGPSARRLKSATRSACSTLSWMLTERWMERVTSPRRSLSVTVSPSCQGSLVSVMHRVAHKQTHISLHYGGAFMVFRDIWWAPGFFSKTIIRQFIH